MTEPRRLLDLQATDSAAALEQELVSSLQPPDEARGAVWQRVTAQVGLAAGASAVIGAATAKAVTSASTTAATTTAAGATGLSTPTAAAAGSMGLLPKLGIVLALATPAVGVGVHAYNQVDDPVVEAGTPTPAPMTTPAAATKAAPGEGEQHPEREASEPKTPKPPTKAQAVPKVQAKSAEERAASRLSEENSLLRKARSQMQTGNPSAALATLAQMDRRFAKGALAQERQLLRIQALSAQGSKAQAQQHARAFIKAYPTSPYAPHLRTTVLGEAERRHDSSKPDSSKTNGSK